jgi:hypothetical protein
MVVYLLELYDPTTDTILDGNSTILNVFSTKEKAEEWRDRYIRDEYMIEDDFDGDLQNEVYPLSFNISKYQVL